MENKNEIQEGSIISVILKYSLPAIVGLMIGALYSIVDRIFIGQGVGEEGIAAVTLGFPIMIITMAISSLIGMGGTVLASIKIGEQKNDEVDKIVGNTFMLLIVTSIVLTVVSRIFLDNILIAFGSSNNLLPYAREYTSIIILGSTFSIVGSGMNNLIRVGGNPKKAMVTLFAGSIMNTILAPIFIFILHMGLTGAAIGTIMSQFISAVWVLSYFFNGKNSLKIKMNSMRLEAEIIKRILAVGVGSFITQIGSSIVNLVLNRVVVKYNGDVSLAAMGIVSTVQTIVLLPIWGISMGIQPLLGQNYGAKNYKRIKEVLRVSLTIATVLAIIGFMIINIFSDQIVFIFGAKSEELTKFASRAIKLYLLCTPVYGIQILGAGLFQSIGKAKVGSILGLTRQGLILVPALLVLPIYFGIDGVLYSGIVSDFVAFLIIGISVIIQIRKLLLHSKINNEMLSD